MNNNDELLKMLHELIVYEALEKHLVDWQMNGITNLSPDKMMLAAYNFAHIIIKLPHLEKDLNCELTNLERSSESKDDAMLISCIAAGIIHEMNLLDFSERRIVCNKIIERWKDHQLYDIFADITAALLDFCKKLIQNHNKIVVNIIGISAEKLIDKITKMYPDGSIFSNIVLNNTENSNGNDKDSVCTDSEKDIAPFKYIEESILDKSIKMQITYKIMNIVKNNAIPGICAKLSDMIDIKEIKLPNSVKKVMFELQRLGMPDENTSKFSYTNFVKYFRYYNLSR